MNAVHRQAEVVGDDCPPEMQDVRNILLRGVSLIEDCNIRDAIRDVFQSPTGMAVTKRSQDLFDCLVSSKLATETFCRFLAGWQSTHVTALYVSGLMIRLHREARETSDVARTLILSAASEMGEVIFEDVGLVGAPHHELFNRLGSRLVGDDRWLLSRYSVPECDRFRKFVKEQRLRAPIEEAILTTAASEIWNMSEFSYLNLEVRPWITKVLGGTADSVEDTVEYVSVHAGETELGHFLHALRAWDLYCQATLQTMKPKMAHESVERYLLHLSPALEALQRVLDD